MDAFQVFSDTYSEDAGDLLSKYWRNMCGMLLKVIKKEFIFVNIYTVYSTCIINCIVSKFIFWHNLLQHPLREKCCLSV